MKPELNEIHCIVFDFGFTLSSDLYFKVAPPSCPEWHTSLQSLIFETPLFSRWMRGDINVWDIAAHLAQYFVLDEETIVATLEAGCRNLAFNPAVLAYAKEMKRVGKKTVLATANIDLFTTVVVPSHGLNDLFDIILNSFDYKTLDKRVLWDLAFDHLGVSYSESLLIEDGPKEPALFRAKGGYAYQYQGDEALHTWLTANSLTDRPYHPDDNVESERS